MVGTNCRTDNKIRFYDWVLSEVSDITSIGYLMYYMLSLYVGLPALKAYIVYFTSYRVFAIDFVLAIIIL